MSSPQIDLVPLRSAVQSDSTTTLDVLIRIVPPRTESQAQRPLLNLGIVLDRSGSMAEGKKMEFAREAAAFAVEQLLPIDRISVIAFGGSVDTIVRSVEAEDKPAILQQIGQVRPCGSTALHAGWSEGAEQVRAHQRPERLNRVLLLSDGLANAGLVDPKAIAADVRGMHQRGVGTTTLGVGDDFNEDLLEAMAKAGDGNYYYIENAVQLADIFQTELRGLLATLGSDVRLRLETRNGVEIADLLNDFDTLDPGHWQLPNLIHGMPLEVLARLTVPPQSNVAELLRVRLSWDAPGVSERESMMKLLILPALAKAEWQALPEEPSVRERAVLLAAARLKLLASASMDRGDLVETHKHIRACLSMVKEVPSTVATADEIAAIRMLEEDLEAGANARMRKRALAQRHDQTRSRRQP